MSPAPRRIGGAAASVKKKFNLIFHEATMSVADDEAAEKVKARIIEIQGSLFSKAAAYANLILLGGYVGAFTIWGNTKTQLSATANIVIAGLLTLSLIVFIFFEVFKMARQAIHFRKVSDQIRLAKTSQEFLKRWAEYEREILKGDVLNYRVWVACLGFCTFTALLAAIWMLVSFWMVLFSAA